MSVENRAAVLANRGFPCCVRFPLQVHAVAITPADSLRASLFSLRDLRPSLKFSQVGFRIALLEACSAFTTRYGLHLRQVAFTRPSTPKASADSLPPLLLRLLPAGATVAGWVSHPLKIAAFSRRTELFGLKWDPGPGPQPKHGNRETLSLSISKRFYPRIWQADFCAGWC